MSALVVYFSKFGNTRQIAKAIAEALGAAGPVRVLSLKQLTVSEMWTLSPNRRFASLLFGFVILLVVVTACAKPTPSAVPTPAPSEEAVDAPTRQGADWDDREVFRAGLIGAEQDVLDQLPGATVYHISLDIPADFDLLQGHQDVRYTNREDEPLDEVYFRLFPNVSGGALTVSNVRVDGETVEPVHEAQDSSLRAPLPTALPPGGQIVIQMDFEVQITRQMGGNYGLFGYFDDVLVLDEFYPAIPAYDDAGWYADAPASNGDLSYFDASFYLVRVTAPADLVIVASGVEVAREQDGERQIVTIAAGPARDFYLAASERYVVVSETMGETTVNSYAFAEHREGAELALEIAGRALGIFSRRFGAYPYTEFDVASTPMRALGIEYPGMTGITLDVYDLDAEIWGLPAAAMMESVVAHEVGHQWFYNVVGNDQMGEPWMDEAIVQYLTGLYYEDAHGEAAAQSYRDSWDHRWNRVERAEIPIGLPAGDYAGSEYGAIVYGRGPLFVQALAQEMGQETFDEFLRDYYETHEWGIGTGEEFRQLAEQHCQCDLSEMFEAWVYQPETMEEVTFTAEDGIKLSGTLFGEGDVAIILAHQGTVGADQTTWQPFARLLAENGFTALTFDFRGVGKSEGKLETPRLIYDVNGAINFLHERGYDRIACVGASMGGTACLRAALDQQLAGLVVFASTMSIGSPTAAQDDELAHLNIPKLFLTASGDHSIVVNNTTRMYEVSAEPKALHIFEDMTEHGTDLFDTDVHDELTDVLLTFIVSNVR